MPEKCHHGPEILARLIHEHGLEDARVAQALDLFDQVSHILNVAIVLPLALLHTRLKVGELQRKVLVLLFRALLLGLQRRDARRKLRALARQSSPRGLQLLPEVRVGLTDLARARLRKPGGGAQVGTLLLEDLAPGVKGAPDRLGGAVALLEDLILRRERRHSALRRDSPILLLPEPLVGGEESLRRLLGVGVGHGAVLFPEPSDLGLERHRLTASVEIVL